MYPSIFLLILIFLGTFSGVQKRRRGNFIADGLPAAGDGFWDLYHFSRRPYGYSSPHRMDQHGCIHLPALHRFYCADLAGAGDFETRPDPGRHGPGDGGDILSNRSADRFGLCIVQQILSHVAFELYPGDFYALIDSAGRLLPGN